MYESLNFNSNISVFSTKFETPNEIYNHDYYLAQKIAKHYGLNLYTTNITFDDYLNNFEKSFSHIEEINRNINNPAYYINYINQKIIIIDLFFQVMVAMKYLLDTIIIKE